MTNIKLFGIKIKYSNKKTMDDEIENILQECEERREKGRQKYGSGDFRNKNMANEIKEEFLDIINYCFFQLIKLKELDKRVKIYEKEKKDNRNQEIDAMLGFLKKAIGIDHFADSKKERYIGMHLVNLIKKIGKTEFLYRLEVILAEDFKRKNCNRVNYVYNELKAFIPPKQNNLQDNFIS